MSVLCSKVMKDNMCNHSQPNIDYCMLYLMLFLELLRNMLPSTSIFRIFNSWSCNLCWIIMQPVKDQRLQKKDKIFENNDDKLSELGVEFDDELFLLYRSGERAYLLVDILRRNVYLYYQVRRSNSHQLECWDLQWLFFLNPTISSNKFWSSDLERMNDIQDSDFWRLAPTSTFVTTVFQCMSA